MHCKALLINLKNLLKQLINLKVLISKMKVFLFKILIFSSYDQIIIILICKLHIKNFYSKIFSLRINYLAFYNIIQNNPIHYF
jgi:hypothetical protein